MRQRPTSRFGSAARSDRLGFGVLALGLAAAAAQGQSGITPAGASFANVPALSTAPNDRWHLSAEIGAWYVAPGGDLNLPQSGPGPQAPQTFVSDINMDSPRLSPSAEINLTKGKGDGAWGVNARGFLFASSERAFEASYSGRLGDLIFASGESLQSSLDFGTFELEGTRRWDLPTSDAATILPSVDLVGGARAYTVDWKVERRAPSGGGAVDVAQFDGEFVEGYVGAKLRLELAHNFTIDVLNTFGWGPFDNSAYSWDIILGFQWRPSEHLGVQIGYRQLLFSLESGDGSGAFKYSGALAGLYGGIVVAF